MNGVISRLHSPTFKKAKEKRTLVLWPGYVSDLSKRRYRMKHYPHWCPSEQTCSAIAVSLKTRSQRLQ
jgi:hypothetical protein